MHAVTCSGAVGTYCPVSSSTNGIACPVGFFCAGAAATPVPCTCAAGYVCDGGTTTATTTAGSACPAGFYCTGGTAAKAQCPAGRYGGSTKRSTSSCTAACVLPTCAIGYYCPAQSTTASGTKCPVGFACRGGGNASGAFGEREFMCACVCVCVCVCVCLCVCVCRFLWDFVERVFCGRW
jgi:hypothetical protein